MNLESFLHVSKNLGRKELPKIALAAMGGADALPLHLFEWKLPAVPTKSTNMNMNWMIHALLLDLEGQLLNLRFRSQADVG